MITLEQALLRLDRAIVPLGQEVVGLDAALGRVLAEEVCADRDFPPTDRSAMDGFAVRSGDLPYAGPFRHETRPALPTVHPVRVVEPAGKSTLASAASAGDSKLPFTNGPIGGVDCFPTTCIPLMIA